MGKFREIIKEFWKRKNRRINFTRVSGKF